MDSGGKGTTIKDSDGIPDISPPVSLLGMLSLTIPITIPSYVILSTITHNPIHVVLYGLFLISFTTLHNVILNQGVDRVNHGYILSKTTMCGLFPLKGLNLTDMNRNISISQFILCFSAMFLLYPMFQVGNIDIILLLVFVVFMMVDMAYKLMNLCTSLVGLVISGLFGLLCGLISISLALKMMGSDSFLYQSKSGTVCTKPTRQKMVCNVYKGGKLIHSNSS